VDISRTGFYLFYKLQAGTALGYMMVTVTLRLEGGLRYNSVLGAKSLTASTIAAEGRAGANTLPEPPSLFLACWPGSRTRRDSTRNKKTETDGWADETFLIKHCVLSANEENGNSILAVFMALLEFSIHAGDYGNSNHHVGPYPAIPGGKASGDLTFRLR
jgi:hypothetical protein